MDKKISKENNFDFLRLIAASQVMVTHTFLYTKIPLPYALGFLNYIPGVPIFFVISGFLISASWKRNTDVGNYFTKRASRIFPALWCCITITAILAALFGFNILSPMGVIWFAAQLGGLIFTPGLLRDFGIGSYNTSLWTIPVELQFYIVLPILYFATSNLTNRRPAIIAVFLAFFAFSLWSYGSWLPQLGAAETGLQKLARYSFLPHFYLFVAGVLLQEFDAQHSKWIRGKGLYWLAAYTVVAAILPVEPVTVVARHVFLAITAISLAYTLPSLANRIIRGRDISYGVYIYHGLMINIVVELGLQGHLVAVPAVIGGAILFAIASWFLIESPCIKLAHEVQKRNRSKAQTA